MGAEIRAFEPADWSAAMRLWQQTEGVGLSADDSPAGIARFLERNPGSSLVAFDGGDLVGTLLCGHDGRRGLLHHLAVRASHRGHGLGRELVQRALVALRDQGIAKCHLLVFRDNAPARAFWERVGGEERVALAAYSLPTGGA